VSVWQTSTLYDKHKAKIRLTEIKQIKFYSRKVTILLQRSIKTITAQVFSAKFVKKIQNPKKWCRSFSKRPKIIFVLRENQLSSFYYLYGIAYFYIARK
jgi:hypothetical protein